MKAHWCKGSGCAHCAGFRTQHKMRASWSCFHKCWKLKPLLKIQFYFAQPYLSGWTGLIQRELWRKNQVCDWQHILLMSSAFNLLKFHSKCLNVFFPCNKLFSCFTFQSVHGQNKLQCKPYFILTVRSLATFMQT